jgi:monofunctional biosynthetic peptidoglycan transglycosylase
MMKARKKKSRLKYLIISSIVVMLFTPLYIYFAYNVLELKSEYPHLKVNPDKSVEVEVKARKPSQWVDMKGISKSVKGAIVLSEDWAFYQHEGLDVNQIKVAISEMVEDKRFRGASTITQQMVKNVYLAHSPTLWRKIQEILMAQKVEKVLSKDRILEIYLNCIEYGPGIYGIKAAAQHYFRKHPSELGPRESAFLAMLLPSPKRYYVSFKRKQLTAFAKLRVKAILKKMRQGKIISENQYENEINRKFTWEY